MPNSVFNILDKEKKLVVAHKFMERWRLSEIPAFRELLDDLLHFSTIIPYISVVYWLYPNATDQDFYLVLGHQR